MPTTRKQDNNDVGSLHIGQAVVQRGQRVYIHGEPTARLVSYFQPSSAKGNRIHFKGSGGPITTDVELTWDVLPNEGDDWTEAECRATVEAYLDLNRRQRAGEQVNKAELYRKLGSGPLAVRTVKAIERKFMNVSAVLSRLGMPWAEGLKPNQNNQNLLETVVAKALRIEDLSAPTDDHQVARERAIALKRAGSKPRMDVGTDAPKKTTKTISSTERLPEVHTAVLARAAGKCELCCQPAPFLDESNEPYLEVHHITLLSAGGADRPENAAGVCPNCHRRLHYGAAKESLADRLRDYVASRTVAQR